VASPSNPDSDDSETISTHRLKRALGPWTAIAIVVGSVIGSGVFFKPGGIAQSAGSFPLIISVWVLGGVLCMLGGFCFAELAAMFPQAGGLYVYLRETYGRLVAFLFGWSEVLLAKPGAIGALSVAFTDRVDVLCGGGLSEYSKIVIAAVVVLGLAMINIFGVAWGGRMQLGMTIVKAGLVLAIAMLPFVLMPFLKTTIQLENYLSTAPPKHQGMATQIGAVLLAVMWAYHGWHGITPLAEEIRDPQRNIPLGLIGGIGTVMFLYVAANISYHGVLSMSELQAAGQRGAEVMLMKLIGPIGQAAMAFIIMCSTFGAMNSNVLETPRVAFAMGRDGVFFRSLGWVHATFHTPVLAILVTAFMSIGMLLSVAVAKVFVIDLRPDVFESELASKFVTGIQQNTVFDLLTNFVVFASSVFHMLVVLAVFILRWRRPDAPRPYKTFGYPFVPAAFLIIYLWFMYQIYIGSRAEAQMGILLIALGVPAYWTYRYWSKSP
jgi:APA family basic amino acid/polyamine antiporter